MGKNLLVIGGGGREHALAWKLLQSDAVERVFIAPGNGARTRTIIPVTIPQDDVEQLLVFIKSNAIHYVVVGPEAPLVAGVVDRLEQEHVLVFGPSQKAAELEASKSFAKQVMQKAKVPTGAAEVFTEIEPALEFLQKLQAPYVVKADGLAAGKGVLILNRLEDAELAVRDCLELNRFGSAGACILIEEFLAGKEASVMAIVNDGYISMLPISSDYKRVGDEDSGPNTGGMGAISPSTVISEDRLLEIRDKIFIPTIEALKNQGIAYKGFLYAGLMVSADGSYKVLEFNCRLGDPETQALMLRIDCDLYSLIETAILSPKDLPEIVPCTDRTSITVVLASAGYPGEVGDGKVIEGVEQVESEGLLVFHSGTISDGSSLLSKGGRILTVTAQAKDSKDARELVYNNILNIGFEGMQYRKDIGL